MKAIEVSRLAGTSVHTIRYYERIGLLKAPRSRSNGYHDFSPEHVGRLVFIRRARGMGLSLAEVRVLVACSAHGRSRCPQACDIISRVLPAVEREIAELSALRAGINRSVRTWRRLPGGLPSGKDVRQLMNSLSA